MLKEKDGTTGGGAGADLFFFGSSTVTFIAGTLGEARGCLGGVTSFFGARSSAAACTLI